MNSVLLVMACLLKLANSPVEKHKDTAVFAILVGTNHSVDKNQSKLQYADDDAASFFDFFRAVGAANTYLLSNLDENTRRLHSQASAESLAPRLEVYKNTLQLLAKDIATARASGLSTVLYFYYAGHGNIYNGEGYISLEDARISGNDLVNDIINKIPADQFHLIVDACNSFFLAYPRGPGGKHRSIQNFVSQPRLAANKRIGLLLSTSSANESHEWEGFQGGVFSHVVRSGLYGAADANNDGRVSYLEIAAFVSQASASVPNERFRPKIFARPPQVTNTLVDLREPMNRSIQIDGDHADHWILEDGLGVRILDFHNQLGQVVNLIQPRAHQGKIFLRSASNNQEYEIPFPKKPQQLEICYMSPHKSRIEARGAAHEAFQMLFARPFGIRFVNRYSLVDAATLVEREERKSSTMLRSRLGWGSLAVGAVAGVIGGGLHYSTMKTDDSSSQSQIEHVDRLNSLNRRRRAANILYIAAGATAILGAVLLLLPENPTELPISVSPGNIEARF